MLNAVRPFVRSSDENLAYTCPFLYYLVRRLGITPRLKQSEALSVGSWFHTLMQLTCDPHNSDTLDGLVGVRLKELANACAEGGIVGPSRDEVIQREEREIAMAKCFHQFALTLPLPNSPHTLGHLLKNQWRPVAVEPRLVHINENTGIRRIAQPDALLYHPEQKVLWIADWKTCTGSARDRLATCPHEFQTQHYLSVAQAMLPDILAYYCLPDSTRLGGVIHVAIQKCPLKFGTLDRPYHLTATSVRSARTGTAHPQGKGWRITIADTSTGEQVHSAYLAYEEDASALLHSMVGTKVGRTYAAEPSFDSYVARCASWYGATGEYQNLATDRTPGSLIDISYTLNYISQPHLDTHGHHSSYWARLITVDRLASNPDFSATAYPKRSSHLTQWGTVHPYFHFYNANPSEWESIATRLNMSVAHRDADILDATTSCIIPSTIESPQATIEQQELHHAQS